MTSHHYSIFNGHSYWWGLKKLDTRKRLSGILQTEGRRPGKNTYIVCVQMIHVLEKV